jgi:hypothetical protein
MCCTGKKDKKPGVYKATNIPVVDPSTGVQLSSISYLLVAQEDEVESEEEDEEEEEDKLKNDDNDEEEEDGEDNYLDKVSKVSSPSYNH